MFRNRASWLDQIVYSFQHRWETNAQYRAAVSGVVGLALVITMCACTGVVSAATSAALASVGLGGGSVNPASQGNLNTGTNRVAGAKNFPTATVVLNPGTIPGVSQLPNSLTPMPQPTATPTATRGTFPGGPNPPGGPGTVVTTCSGVQGSSSWSLSPCPLIHNQPGTLTIIDKRHPGATTNVVISFCSAPSCALDFPPDNSRTLNSSGVQTISFTVPDQAANSTTPVTGFISITGGQTMSITAAPVQ